MLQLLRGPMISLKESDRKCRCPHEYCCTIRIPESMSSWLTLPVVGSFSLWRPLVEWSDPFPARAKLKSPCEVSKLAEWWWAWCKVSGISVWGCVTLCSSSLLALVSSTAKKWNLCNMRDCPKQIGFITLILDFCCQSKQKRNGKLEESVSLDANWPRHVTIVPSSHTSWMSISPFPPKDMNWHGQRVKAETW